MIESNPITLESGLRSVWPRDDRPQNAPGVGDVYRGVIGKILGAVGALAALVVLALPHDTRLEQAPRGRVRAAH